ncbi:MULTISPECIES: plasmid partitioning/stability family protein [Klebsiella pneumoniae complex]|uniref:plasmid partitioning/stability family protein n=1 Tax=Klebsiella pneumoniae complex TaxID=3390273 RepID=UPI0009427E5A|nr:MULTISPECIES: plasmid partitioning/stability family protein [Klebsiella]KAA1733964.1 protein stbB [Klebsiella pneumoniae]MBD6998538.1 protein stbB [Klebsiella pneumoniae]MBH8338181.1 protein stbB [Klebsiella pneumoniae]MBR8576275.1 protein stbB [Klebsiella pneumoniae subsp. pneumoniae]MCR1231197.1 plasmid partitioning/stability family protein [Klebsiella quasipneumoniae]
MDKRRTITFKINPDSNVADNVVSSTLDSVPQGERGRLSRAALAAGLALYRQDARLPFILCELLTHDLSYSEIEQILKSIQIGERKRETTTGTNLSDDTEKKSPADDNETKSNARKLIS